MLADTNLSLVDKLVYAAISTLNNFKSSFTGMSLKEISINDIYFFIQKSVSIGAIRRSLDKLKKLNYISVVPTSTGHKNMITAIKVYAQSEHGTESLSIPNTMIRENKDYDQIDQEPCSRPCSERARTMITENKNHDQSDHPINIINNKKEEKEEETPSPSFSYSTQYQKESRKESSDKFYKDAFQKYPRELVRAHEVSQCIDEMCECYELNAKEFERSKSNFKQTVRNRAEKIVKVLLDDKSDFAPMEVFWGIRLYETSSTSEPTPAGIKKSCIKCRIERNNYTDKLKYVLNLRSDDLNVPEDDFLLTSFVNRFGSELEGLENARYSESKDYDVKFNDLVLKMAELPVQDNIPDYWTMYRNQSGALPINLDIRQIA